MLLYQIVHKESGHKYVGQTTRPPIKRWREHLYSLRKGKHANRYLQFSWNKYGESAFKFEIIKEFQTLEELNAAEIDMIKTGSNLFNLAGGGNARTHSPKIRKAIGKSNKKPIIGMCVKTHSTKEYESAADTALDGFNPACVRKCVSRYVSPRGDGVGFKSLSHKGWVWAVAGTDKGSMVSLALSAKRSKVRLERSVIGMHIFTKEIIEFASITEASRNGFNLTTVRRCCVGEIKVHKGFVWVYADIGSPQSLLKSRVDDYMKNPPKTGAKSWQ